MDDLLVLLGTRAEHLDQLVNGSGGNEGANDPPPFWGPSTPSLSSNRILTTFEFQFEVKPFSV